MKLKKYALLVDREIVKIDVDNFKISHRTPTGVWQYRGWELVKPTSSAKSYNLYYHIGDGTIEKYGKVIRTSNYIVELLQIDDCYFKEFSLVHIINKDMLDKAKHDKSISQIYKLNKNCNYVRYEVE